ncbi:NADH-ubiquinone oxidoreductase 21.3 kDa subunit [Xylariaceae sp. FL1651]|nr:NADH-ubiquinone oxidoreductase 21.3 kDa subunit [Xylariaceae sp. FL1651]
MHVDVDISAVAKAVGGVVPVSQKQTLQSVGIWERVRRAFAVDPNRSSGVPLNPYFRNPPPGALDPLSYDDPVTVPAGDIADNPYWKRDVRRAYPRLSFVNQGDAVALLSVGSAAAPKQELVGDAGAKQLVAAAEEGKAGGLAAFLEKNTAAVAAKDVLVDGLPPLPSGQKARTDGKWETYRYDLAEENSYPEDYPCRNFQ